MARRLRGEITIYLAISFIWLSQAFPRNVRDDDDDDINDMSTYAGAISF
jgi:hypothetical protein